MRRIIALLLCLLTVSPAFAAAGALRQSMMQPPGWAKPMSSPAIDFTNRRFSIRDQGYQILFGQQTALAGNNARLLNTRSSVKYCDSQAGVWSQAPIGATCISDKGALIEEARTNSIRNN